MFQTVHFFLTIRIHHPSDFFADQPQVGGAGHSMHNGQEEGELC